MDLEIDEEMYNNFVRMIYSKDLAERRMVWVIISNYINDYKKFTFKESFQVLKLSIHIDNSGLDNLLWLYIADPEDIDILTNIEDTKHNILLTDLVLAMSNEIRDFKLSGYLEEKKRILNLD